MGTRHEGGRSNGTTSRDWPDPARKGRFWQVALDLFLGAQYGASNRLIGSWYDDWNDDRNVGELR